MALVARLILPLVVAVWSGPAVEPAASSAAEPGTWAWPVVGPILRAFDPPETPFGSGHRGVDIAVAVGTAIVAPEAGTVSFAGKVGGELFVTIDHGGGLSSTYSWLSAALVRRGDVVARGSSIALGGAGHAGSTVPHLHLGVRRDGEYLDPLDFLGPIGVSGFIRLAPLGGEGVAFVASVAEPALRTVVFLRAE